jgi:hypothetical protein
MSRTPIKWECHKVDCSFFFSLETGDDGSSWWSVLCTALDVRRRGDSIDEAMGAAIMSARKVMVQVLNDGGPSALDIFTSSAIVRNLGVERCPRGCTQFGGGQAGGWIGLCERQSSLTAAWAFESLHAYRQVDEQGGPIGRWDVFPALNVSEPTDRH